MKMAWDTDPQPSIFSSDGSFVRGKSCGQPPLEPVHLAWFHVVKMTDSSISLSPLIGQEQGGRDLFLFLFKYVNFGKND